MRFGLLVLCALAGPAQADQRTFEFLGGYGCTLGPQSENALIEAGFLQPYTIAIINDALARGVARQEGEYVVLDQSVCTIRLPDIQSPIPVSSPEIRAIAPYIRDVFEFEGQQQITEGCFIENGNEMFTRLNNGDIDAGTEAYLNFLAAGIISGDVRFFAPSPLETPLGFQILTGPCASAPNMSDVTPSHDVIASGFGRFVREVGARTQCGDDLSGDAMGIAAEIQGVGAVSDNPPDGFNAWLFFEYHVITLAAGWHDGTSGTNRGTPRPPLCQDPD